MNRRYFLSSLCKLISLSLVFNSTYPMKDQEMLEDEAAAAKSAASSSQSQLASIGITGSEKHQEEKSITTPQPAPPQAEPAHEQTEVSSTAAATQPSAEHITLLQALAIYEKHEVAPAENSLAHAATTGDIERVEQMVARLDTIKPVCVSLTPVEEEVSVFGTTRPSYHYPINELDINGKTALQEAVCNGYTSIVTCLLSSKYIDTELYSDDGLTALHYAVLFQQNDIAKLLIRYGATIDRPRLTNYSSLIPYYGLRLIAPLVGETVLRCASLYGTRLMSQFEGATALHYASNLGNTELVDSLFASGAQVDCHDNFQRNALHYACLTCNDAHYQVIQKLLMQHPNVNQQDLNGKTPLLLAIASSGTKRTEIVQLLIARKANVNKVSYNHTPLIQAVLKNDISMVELLIKLGADINLKNWKGYTALDVAIAKKFDDIQKILVKKSIPIHTVSKRFVDRQSAYCLQYPLHSAAQAGNLDLVNKLLQEKIYVNLIDLHGATALHYACQLGHRGVIEQLIANGANPLKKDRQGKTPLHYAIEKGQAEAVTLLLSKVPLAKFEAEITYDSYLHYAATFNFPEVVKALLEKGAREIANKKNPPSMATPLHSAVQLGNTKIVPLLLSKNWINAQDQFGQTPLHKAIIAKRLSLAILLIKHGAYLHTQDMDQMDPFNYSEQHRNSVEPLLNTDFIVQQHAHIDEQEEKALFESLDLEALGLQDLQIKGKILASLNQHSVCSQMSNKYCGYYALYNAINFFMRDHRAYAPERLKFAAFFHHALRTMQSAGNNPPYDNLSTKDIRFLIGQLCPTLPIAVIEADHCMHFLTHPEVFDNSIQQALELEKKDKDLEHLENFLHKRSNEIAIVVGLGSLEGHWFVLYARRDNDTVSVRIMDSLDSLDDQKQDIIADLCKKEIIVLYLMLTNPIADWHKVIDSNVLEELAQLKLHFLKMQLPPIKNPHELLVTLDNMLEAACAVQQSFRDFISCIMHRQQLSTKLKIIHALRLKIFSMAALILNFNLFNVKLDRDAKKELRKAINDLNRVLLYDQPKLVAGLQGWSISQVQLNDLRDLHTKSEELLTIITPLLELKELVAQVPDSFTSNDFYDEPMAQISPNKLSCINEHMQPEIKAFVSSINSAVTQAKFIILHGLPGNGKTTIAQAIAQLTNRKFLVMRVPALGTKYQFSRENQLKMICRFMDKNPNGIILLDEIDALFDTESNKANRSSQVFNEIIDKALGFKDIIFIATTNVDVQKLDQMPPAFRSRFTTNAIRIDNPEEKHRAAIIDTCCQDIAATGLTISLSEHDKQWLVKATKGFSIRDIESIFKLAHQNVFSDTHTAAPSNSPIITFDLVQQAFKSINKTRKGSFDYTWWGNMALQVASHINPWINTGLTIYQMYQQSKHREQDLEREKSHHKEEQDERKGDRTTLTKRYNAEQERLNQAKINQESEKAKDHRNSIALHNATSSDKIFEIDGKFYRIGGSFMDRYAQGLQARREKLIQEKKDNPSCPIAQNRSGNRKNHRYFRANTIRGFLPQHYQGFPIF